jgi:nucleotide-binding universal stress UspA family protein
MAPKLGLPVHAVVVWDYPTLVSGEYYYPEEYIDPQEGVGGVVGNAAEQVFAGDIPEWFTSSLRRGKPARELVKLSEEADLLVVGGRGHGGFAGLMLGSVSDACAAHAHCPVPVVHDR